VAGRRVAVIGGGAVAADCARPRRARRAAVEMFALEKLPEMPLTAKELAGVLTPGSPSAGAVRVTAVVHEGGEVRGARDGQGGASGRRGVPPLEGARRARHLAEAPDLDLVIVAIGARPSVVPKGVPGVLSPATWSTGPPPWWRRSRRQECRARGARLARRGGGTGDRERAGHIRGRRRSRGCAARVEPVRVKSTVVLPGFRRLPVPIGAEFFGRPILSPFLLSAAPPPTVRADVQGVRGGVGRGVMKTAFDNVPIHIHRGTCSRSTAPPSPIATTSQDTRSTASAGRWRSCGGSSRPPHPRLHGRAGERTRGARSKGLAIQYAQARGGGGLRGRVQPLCPQGGDGTKGDIVSQDAELTAKIIGWVLESGDPEVPKLFKLTAAVTSVAPIITAIKEVFARHPQAKSGVTLANTFPTLAFRPGSKERWEEGIVVGMSGAGVTPISNLTLANVSRLGVVVSATAARWTTRRSQLPGARRTHRTVLLDRDEVRARDRGRASLRLSYLLAERGLSSVEELIAGRCRGRSPRSASSRPPR